MLYHRKKLNENNKGIIFEALKSQFKRIDLLIGIITFDILFMGLNNIVSLYSKEFSNSTFIRTLNQLMVFLEIYFFIGLIKLLHHDTSCEH